MKFYGIIALAALSLVACSNDDTLLTPVDPAPVEGGSSTPPVLTPDPVDDKPGQE